MKEYKIVTPIKVGSVELKNRIVMSPMTRSRAIGNVPNELMAEYYKQRSGAGLIITEGTSPSPNGLGYARIPGIFSKQQVEGWKKITSAVHKSGGKIVVQLMHTGRISHPLNLPGGAQILAPSAVKAAGQIWTDSKKLQDFPVPKEMTAEDLLHTKAEYVAAAKNALDAGFDGVELHGANGYLLEQFLSPVSNIRKDNYGGSIENRSRFVIEVVSAVAEAIGKEKTGIRLSPYGVASDMPYYPEIDATYKYLSEQLNDLGIAYMHLVDHSAMGAPVVPMEIKKLIRNKFKNTIILAGGYDKERAETDIQSGLCDLVAFGRPFINNPDLVERLKNNWSLSQTLNMDLFYTADEKGYTDYPFYVAISNEKNKKVVVMATDGFEQSEFLEPINALKKVGIFVDVVSLKEGKITGWKETKWGDKFKVDKTIDNALSTDYDMLVLPGGVMNTDTLRTNESAIKFVADFFEQGKPIAAICHAGSLLIETGLLKGKKMTSYKSIKTDLINAGVNWVDEEVVVDDKLITSRSPKDLPAFCKKMINELKE